MRWVDLSGRDPTDPATGRPADEEEASGARMISLRVRQIEAGMRQAPTTYDHRLTFTRAYEDVADEVGEVHHAVPQEVLTRYPGRFTRAEMHSLANLRGIRVGQVRGLHDLLKRRWYAWYRGHPDATRGQILWRAAQMDIEYGHQFLPRLELPPR